MTKAFKWIINLYKNSLLNIWQMFLLFCAIVLIIAPLIWSAAIIVMAISDKDYILLWLLIFAPFAFKLCWEIAHKIFDYHENTYW